MIRAAVALLVSVSLLGCFPHNARHRTYAQLGEGAAILAGIAISALANTSADCDQMGGPGVDESGCKSSAKWASTAGVTLILGGLLGFVATVSTAEDSQKPKPIEIKATPTAEAKPAADLAAPAAGSADPATAADPAPVTDPATAADTTPAGSETTTP